jgi:hypothetical protein
MHLPQSVFSEWQLDILLWLLQINGIEKVPSVYSMKKINQQLQDMSGIQTLEYDGALGHKFFMNSINDIIAQVVLLQSI